MSVALLTTKLDIPTPRSTNVSRSRLTERLNSGLEARLSLVTAPAGFGKTTLVSEWIACLRVAGPDQCRVAWLSLDEADNQPFRFAVHLIAALQGIEPDLGPGAQTLLNGPHSPPAEVVMTALINDLVTVPVPIVLVLDDYHVIHAEWVHEGLSFLLDHQPRSLHLILISRQDPPLPLSRLRARGQMVEIRVQDLRFTLDEALAFLNQTMGLSLTAEAVAALEARTEGWIAGLQLAALALQERQDVDAFIRAFSGSHHYIIDYLVDEVLRRQPPAMRTFLVQTSILERFCAPLCQAVVQAAPGTQIDARASLAFLEQANLFLVPLDDERHWYRYHHLFADSLRTELDAAEQAALHRRAAQWFSENRLLPEAIHHALSIPDHDLAADLLSQAGQEASLWSGGDFGRYLAWVERLPPEAIRGRPRLQLCYSRALYLFGRMTEAEQTLALVDRQFQESPNPDQEMMAILAIYRAQCVLERGDWQTTQQLAEYAIQHLAPPEGIDHARAYYALACAHYAQGHMGAAAPLFEQGSRIAEHMGALTLALSSGECAARCLALLGRLDTARRKSEQIIAMGQTGGTCHPLIVGALLTLSEVAYQQNDLGHIEPLIRQAINLTQPMGRLVRAQQCWAYLQLARLRQAQRDPEGAARAADQAYSLAYELDNPFFKHVFAARQEWAGLIQNPDRALVLHERVFMPTVFYALAEFAALAQAYQMIVQRHPADALPILDRLLDAAQQDERGIAAIELQIWRALAFQALKQEDRALEALKQAMLIALPQGCQRPFLDVGLVIGVLLQQLALQNVGGSLARAVLDTFQVETQSSPSPAAARPLPPVVQPSCLVEPLSDRELEVLRLIANGLSNKEIADELIIGVGTVKWYATTIYSKLGVGSRTQAAARAKELGLLS